jgi:hypothetical protein
LEITFSAVTEGTDQPNRAPSFARINDDTYRDIVISADFNQSQVFINNQDGTFTTTDVDVIIDQHGMSFALGDYDNAGDLDIYHTNRICADFDDDGDVDIFQTHRGLPVAATLWRNDYGPAVSSRTRPKPARTMSSKPS